MTEQFKQWRDKALAWAWTATKATAKWLAVKAILLIVAKEAPFLLPAVMAEIGDKVAGQLPKKV